MASPVLVWHRRDLRVHDNKALHAACQHSDRVIPVFVLDPDILARPDIAPARVSYMLDALRELQRSYAQLGGSLVVRRGDPVRVLPQLA